MTDSARSNDSAAENECRTTPTLFPSATSSFPTHSGLLEDKIDWARRSPSYYDHRHELQRKIVNSVFEAIRGLHAPGMIMETPTSPKS